MAIVATLLDKARTRRGIPTDMALAERIGRSRAVVSEWRAGKSYPDEDLIVTLAELAGDAPGEWLLAVKAVRTEGKAGKVWADLAKRLGAVTAGIAVVALALSTTDAGHTVMAAMSLIGLAFPIGPDLHYAKLRGWPSGTGTACAGGCRERFCQGKPCQRSI